MEYYDNGLVQLLELHVTEDAPVLNRRLLEIDHHHPFLVVGIIREEEDDYPRRARLYLSRRFDFPPGGHQKSIV